MTMQIRQQRETFRKRGEAISMKIPQSWKKTNSVDVDPVVAGALP